MLSSESSNNSKSRSIFRTPWKRKKKAKNSTTSLTDDVTNEASQDEEEVEGSTEGFALITPTSLTEAEKERNKMVIKGCKFSWSSHRCLMEGLQGVTLRAHIIKGEVYLCSGATATGQPNNRVFRSSARKINQWDVLADESPQFYAASTVIDHELVLIGGINSSDNTFSNTLSTFDKEQKAWVEVLPRLPYPRSAATATVWGDYLIIVGGITQSGKFLDTVQLLHLPSRQWHTALSLPVPLAGTHVLVYRSRLYVMGGSSKEGLVKSLYSIGIEHLLASFSRINRLTSSTALWLRHQDCPYTMMSLCLFNGYMVAVGGNEATASLSQPAEWVWAYFPEDDSQNWTLVQRMNSPRKLCCCAPLSTTTLGVFGGNPFYSVVDVATVTASRPLNTN